MALLILQILFNIICIMSKRKEKKMSTFLDVTRQQFEIQKLKENLYCVTFRPCNRFLAKEFEILVRDTHKFYELVATVDGYIKVNWWTLNYLAYLCEKYNGSYLI